LLSSPSYIEICIQFAYKYGKYILITDKKRKPISLYNIDFEYKNGSIYYPYIRMYTSFPSTELLLDDTQNLYFKGSVIGA
jgi:hypothetical protein